MTRALSQIAHRGLPVSWEDSPRTSTSEGLTVRDGQGATEERVALAAFMFRKRKLDDQLRRVSVVIATLHHRRNGGYPCSERNGSSPHSRSSRCRGPLRLEACASGSASVSRTRIRTTTTD